MRRLTSLLVVGAVAALALAAAIDGVRSGRSAQPDPAPLERTAKLDGAVAFGGTLVFLDRNCGLRSVSLPSLAPFAPPRRVECGLGLDARGRLVRGRERWQPGGELVARCAGERVIVETSAGEPILRRRGCSPAWKPDGSLTYVVDGGLALSSRLRDRRTILSAAQIARGTATAATTFAPAALRDVAWLDSTRVAALLTTSNPPGPERLDLIVVFEHGRAVAGGPFLAPRVSGLEASPRGRFLVVRTGKGPREALAMLDRDGRPLDLSFVNALAIAWSPDERWAAVATPKSVLIFRTSGPELRLRRLPIAATDVAWVS